MVFKNILGSLNVLYNTGNHMYVMDTLMQQSCAVMLAGGSKSRFGSGSGSNPEPDRCKGFLHMKTRTIVIGPVLSPKPGISTLHFRSN
jgi:hypothetical protein